MNHVTPLVGGFLSQQRHIGQDGVRFTPVPRARQTEATQFLLDQRVHVAAFLVQPELLRRMEPAGVINRVRTAQASVLNGLLQRPDRPAGRTERPRRPGRPTAVQFLKDVRSRHLVGAGDAGAGRSTPYRRNTQRLYLDTHRQPAEWRESRTPKCARCCAASCGRCGDRSWRRCRRPPIARRACTSRTRAIRSTRFSIRARCGTRGGAGRAAGAGPAVGIAAVLTEPLDIRLRQRSVLAADGPLLDGLFDLGRDPRDARIQPDCIGHWAGHRGRHWPGGTRHSKCLDERSFSAQMNSISSSPDISCWRIVRAVNGRV